MNTIIIILVGILFASIGQILWKVGVKGIGIINSFSIEGILQIGCNPYIIAGLICYGLGTIFWLIALSRADLSYVYPFIALTFVIIFIASSLLFHEPISLQKLSGAVIIIIGILVLVRG